MLKTEVITKTGLEIILKKNENLEDVNELCEIAKKAKLFIDGWELQNSLDVIQHFISKGESEDNNDIIIAFYKNNPIGIIVKSDIGEKKGQVISLQFFVKEEFRRNGIGTILHENINCKKAECECGSDGSELFFEKLSINYYKNGKYHKVKTKKKPFE